jgi:hypothetical protein
MKKPGPPPAWTMDVGGPNPALPGGSAEATPKDGKTHFEHGMTKEFTVAAK